MVAHLDDRVVDDRLVDDRVVVDFGAYSQRECACRQPPMLKDGELRLKYQPKLDLCTGRIFGVEALMRWHHPQRGMLEPHAFIPQAEKAGTIDQLDSWAIQESCRQAHAWQEHGEFSGSVAVNISARELSQPRFVDVVSNALERHRVDPHRLILEITESCPVDDLELALDILDHLAQLGVGVSLDDFGTGYASLAYLKYLPISEVKVDRCFIKDIEHCDEDFAIVTAIISMARAKGACVVAEGVETARQLVLLAAMGCGGVQGYLIGRPMGPRDLVGAVINIEKLVGPGGARTARWDNPCLPWQET